MNLIKVELDQDKSPFYQVGTSLFLSIADPGPIEIDLDEFPTQERNQIIYGLRTGVLRADKEIKIQTSFSTPQEAPVKEVEIKEEVTIDQKLAAEKTEAKKILSGSVATVKRRLGDIQNIRQLKTLLSVEQDGSARKTVVKTLQQMLNAHIANIQGTIAVENNTLNQEVSKKTELTKGLGGLVNLDNLTDVVESDIEQITIKIPTDEE